MSTERVLADFEGTWTIARTIVQGTADPVVFEGQGVWSHTSAGLDYVETGLLRMSGVRPMRAERRYVWRRDLSVFFADGRFFHAVPAGGGHTVHLCDPDTYDVTYDFDAWPRFCVRWDVRGPHKSYVSDSVYTRACD